MAQTLFNKDQAVIATAANAGYISAADWTTFNNKPTTIAALTDVSITSPIVNQLLTFNGAQWINSSPGAVSISNGINFYLTATASGISTYDVMQKIPDTDPEIDESIVVTSGTSPLDFEQYISNVELDGTGNIDAGVWSFNFYTYSDTAVGTNTFTYDVYRRTSGGTETLLFSVTTDNIINTSVQLMSTITVQPAFAGPTTDKLLLKVTASTTNVGATTMHLVHSGTTHYSYINTPLTLRHNDLDGLQGGATTERYHLNLAQYTIATQAASTSVSGYLSATDFTTFNNKQPAGTYVTAITINSLNGFTGTSSGGATPALTLATSITGILKGNGTAISAALAGTDYEVPLVFSTGLTRTVDTITANLSTGVSNANQTAIGSTLAGGTLTLQSTSNATKGKILFGTSAYDEVNNRLGIGTTTPTSVLHVVGVSQSTIAVDSPAYPEIRWEVTGTAMQQLATITTGGGYVPTSGANDFIFYNKADTNWLWGHFNGGSPAEVMRLTNSGQLGIGVTSPTAMLHLKAGTATAGTAPLKLTAGTNLTTPEAGAIEFNGTELYYTDSIPLRQIIVPEAYGSMYESNVPTGTNIVMATASTWYGWVTATAGSFHYTSFTDDATADRITIDSGGDGDYRITAQANFNVSAVGAYYYSVGIFKNGTLIPGTQTKYDSSSATGITFQNIEAISQNAVAGDYFDIRFLHTSGASKTITIYKASLMVSRIGR